MGKIEIRTNGTVNFAGIEIPVIEGGFGEGQRIVSAKTISEIHDTPLKEINQSVNRIINKNRFVENVDYIDMMSDKDLKETASYLGLITSNGQKHCYILSERGYTKLIKYMDDDKSWDVMEKFVDEYFAMRKVINSNEQLKASLLLSIYNGGQDGILASKQLTEIEVKEATTPLLQKIKEDKPLTDFAKHVTNSKDAITVEEFSKIVKKEGLDIGGRNKAFSWLREKNFLKSDNLPYQKFINGGYFKVIEGAHYEGKNIKLHTQTLITGKGQMYLLKKIRYYKKLEKFQASLA